MIHRFNKGLTNSGFAWSLEIASISIKMSFNHTIDGREVICMMCHGIYQILMLCFPYQGEEIKEWEVFLFCFRLE